MKTYSVTKWTILSFAIYFLIVGKGFAQFSSTFQSAESVGKGRWEFTGLYSSLSMGYDGESEKLLNNYGVMAGYGITPKTEIRIRYDRMASTESFSTGFHNLFVGPKFSTESGIFAFYLPVGISFEKETESTWMTEPAFIFSIPFGSVVQVNITPSYLIPLGEGMSVEDGLLKFNLGLGIKTKGEWIFRPEVGLQYYAQYIGDGHFLNLGIGVSKRLGGS